MNTFISLARETIVTDMKDALQFIIRIERIARAVEDVWINSIAKQDIKKRDKALRELKVLHELILEKLDQATIPILRYYEKHINEKMIMLLDEVATQVSIGMWASYEEPRPGNKRLQLWENTGIHFENLPKQLLQQADRYIFRIIRTPIVTFNLEAYHQSDLLPLPGSDNKDKNENNGEAESKHQEIDLPSLFEEKGAAGDGTEESKNMVDSSEGIGQESANATETTEHHTPIPHLHGQRGVSAGGAKHVQTLAEKLNLPSHQLKYVVGDLIHFDILIAPPKTTDLRIKKWTLRDASSNSTGLRKSPYPSSVPCKMMIRVPSTVVMSDDLRLCVWDYEKQDWVEDGITEFQYNEGLRMVQFYTTTVGVLALVKRRIVDMPLKSFHMYPVLHKKINELMSYRNDATVSPSIVNEEQFRGLADGHMGTVDSNGASLYSTSYERYCRVLINTQRHNIVIDVVGSQVCLVKPNDPFCADLLGHPMTPGSLFFALQRRGVHLLPTEVDIYLISEGKIKNKVLEEEVLKQVATGASALEFMSSPWNQTLNESQAGILLRESTAYTCPGEENEYECILVERDEASTAYFNTPELGIAPGPDGIQYSLVYGNEYGRRPLYSTVPLPGEERHLDMPRTLTQRISPEAMQRIRRINQRFRKNVHSLLSLAKVYSQS